MTATSDQPDDQREAALRKLWEAGCPVDLRSMLPTPLSFDDPLVLHLVRIDTLERRRAGYPAGMALRERELGAIEPGSRVARWIITEELTHAEREGGASAVRQALAQMPNSHLDLAHRLLGEFGISHDRATTIDDLGIRAHAPRGRAGVTPPPDVVGGEPARDHIGPYRLQKRLGRGGFGDVWLAVDERFQRSVAIKLIRPDKLDDRTIRRFEVERESLRLLAHPNVARILDAGYTEEGQPYLVMEYVQGKPITAYCDDRHLGVTERLQLFAKVCDAVHYIHLQGLLHRDLSPDNIYVVDVDGTEPQPKILDFGVAKPLRPELRLSEQPMSVEFGVAVGKWLYMSPEQAEGGIAGIDARSDIYALGVILYQLLAGVLPLDPDAIARRAIAEAISVLVHTPRPAPGLRLRTLEDSAKSQLARLRGEADAETLARKLDGRVRFLPLHAMSLDRTRRFTSAAAMGDDIRRFLRDEDFSEARRDPWTDKVTRGVRRHWIAVTTAAAVFLIVGALWIEARRGRDAAQIATADTAALLEYVNTQISGENSGSALLGEFEVGEGIPSSVIDSYHAAVREAKQRFVTRPEIRASILESLGGALTRFGAVQPAIEAFDGARDAAREASSTEHRMALLDLRQAEVLWRGGRPEEAMRLCDGAIAVLRRTSATPVELADALNLLGGAQKHSADLDAAAKSYAEALAIRRADPRADERAMLILRHNLALVDVERGKAARASDPELARRLLTGAVAAEREVWADAARSLGADDRDALAPASEVAVNSIRLGMLAGVAIEANAHYADARRVYEQILDPMRASLGRGHWRTLNAAASYGFVLTKLGEHRLALATLEPALEEYRIHRGRAHAETIAVTGYVVAPALALGWTTTAADVLRRTLDDVRAEDPARASELVETWSKQWPEAVAQAQR